MGVFFRERVTHLLDQQIMFEHLSRLHDPHNGRLEIHLAVLLHGIDGLLHFVGGLLLDGRRYSELCPLVRIVHVEPKYCFSLVNFLQHHIFAPLGRKIRGCLPRHLLKAVWSPLGWRRAFWTVPSSTGEFLWSLCRIVVRFFQRATEWPFGTSAPLQRRAFLGNLVSVLPGKDGAARSASCHWICCGRKSQTGKR